MELIRLNKFISDSGLYSRRDADVYIEKGKVTVNGKKASIGDKVHPNDKVLVNGNLVQLTDEYTYILFNKPVGVVSTTDKNEKDNIIDYVGYHERIFPVGRLDKDSQGLIILTNDGDIVNKILRSANNHEKEYLVTVNKPVTDEFCLKMSNNVPIMGINTQKCLVEKVSNFVFRIVLKQGLNRQIRRMCEYFEYEVEQLKRVRIMHLKLGNLPLGEYRELSIKEKELLQLAIADSENKGDVKAKIPVNKPKAKSPQNSRNKPPQKPNSKKRR